MCPGFGRNFYWLREVIQNKDPISGESGSDKISRDSSFFSTWVFFYARVMKITYFMARAVKVQFLTSFAAKNAIFFEFWRKI